MLRNFLLTKWTIWSPLKELQFKTLQHVCHLIYVSLRTFLNHSSSSTWHHWNHTTTKEILTHYLCFPALCFQSHFRDDVCSRAPVMYESAVHCVGGHPFPKTDRIIRALCTGQILTGSPLISAGEVLQDLCICGKSDLGRLISSLWLCELFYSFLPLQHN